MRRTIIHASPGHSPNDSSGEAGPGNIRALARPPALLCRIAVCITSCAGHSGTLAAGRRSGLRQQHSGKVNPGQGGAELVVSHVAPAHNGSPTCPAAALPG